MRTNIKLLFTVIFFAGSLLVWAQQKTISGQVTDSDGFPVSDAYVYVEGTDNGVYTDADGNYALSVNEGDTVAIEFIGFETETVTVGAANKYNVSVSQGGVIELGATVATALGIERDEKALGYGVSEVNGDELAGSGEQNIIQGLAAKAAGVQVIGSGGTPGASSKVLIRGIKSFSNTDPLIVVDGVPIDNSTIQSTAGDYPFNQNLSAVNASNRALDIDPNDIESVTVLKGPAAAALYGSRAGNGVIIYTTKKGKAKKGLGIDLSYSTEFSEVNKLPDLQNRYGAGTGGEYVSPADPGPDGLFFTNDDVAAGTPLSWGPDVYEANLPTYNNIDNFYQTGVSHNVNLALYGGGEKSNFRVSTGYTNMKGIIPNSKLTRANIRLTGDTKLGEEFKAGGTAAYIRTTGTKVQNGSNLAGVSLSLFRAPITFNLADYQLPSGYTNNYFYIYDNPFYSVYRNPMHDEINRTTGNVYLTYLGLDWLNVTTKVGWDVYNDFRQQIYSISSLGDQNSLGLGEVFYDNNNVRNFNAQLLFNGSKDIVEDVVGFNYNFGGEIVTNYYDNQYSRGTTLAVPGIYNLSNASELYTSNYKSEEILRGVFAQAEFDYLDQLFLTLNGRFDESSTFDESPLYGSASASWVFSETFGLKEILSFGKLRYGYALTGITPAPYRLKTYFAQPIITDGFTNGLSFPYNGVNGFGYSSVLQRGGLKPETVKSHEFGIELGFLNNRINLDLSYYDQKSEDVFLFIPIAASSGFTSEYTNAASISNKGVEIELNADVIKTENFTWNLTTNFAKNENEVLSLANGVEEVSLESAFTSIGSFGIVGYPAGAFFGTKWERDGQGNLVIGSDGLPIVSSETGNIGDPNPDWTMGIRNSFTWKGFTLSALLDIREGGDIWNGTYARLNRFGRTAESAENRDGAYIIPGVLEDGSANNIEINARTYFSNYVGDGGAAAEQFVEDGSWIRLRDVSLSYRFSNFAKLAGMNYIKFVEFSVSGRNLWLETDYKGVDPETSLTGAGSLINGLDYFNNPNTKSYFFGVKVGF